MKANQKKGLARKGSLHKTITITKNNGIAKDANEKVHQTRVVLRYQPKAGQIVNNRSQNIIEEALANTKLGDTLRKISKK